MNANLSDFLIGKDWYDNSTLDTIDRCHRKGFWKTVFTLPITTTEATEIDRLATEKGTKILVSLPNGVSENVGVGAHFGSCIHAAFDKYYAPIFYKDKTVEQRKILAFRTFAKKYEQLVKDPDLVDNKYTLSRGMDLLDMYFSHYSEEDLAFRPVETEIAICVEIAYRPTDALFFEPFWYVMRIDAIWERLRYSDFFITEHKTASSPETKLVELLLSRQVRGYYWGATQFDSEKPIEGVLSNVLAVRAAETNPSKLFFRDYIHLTQADAELFRLQTIYKVQRWRDIRDLAATIQPGPLQLAAFDQTTSECTRYGKCAYHDLCLYGPAGTDLSQFQRNTWNPLYSEKLEGE